jgi:hypothetical protein
LCKIPIKASFEEVNFTDFSPPGKSILLFLLPLIIACSEILFNLNTGFYQEGSVVQERKFIFRHYAKTLLLTDSINATTILFIDQLHPIALYVSFFFRIYQV